MTETPDKLQRHLALEKSYNIRDIGGYPTMDGSTTRWRTVLRADSLNHLSPESQSALLDYPIRTIIDLRRSSELRKAPDIFADVRSVRYLNISLLEDERQVRNAGSLLALYRFMLEHCQEQIRRILRLLATEDAFPCLIHCTSGKDRTGLIIALLLSISNVPIHTIANDYALSQSYLAPHFALLRVQLAQDGHDVQRLEWLTPALPETMQATLAYLEEKYGNVQAYLQTLGLTDEHLESLRSSLVE